VIPAGFDYVVAEHPDHAIELLAKRDDAKLLAGGHSLLPAMKLRLARPGLLIDVGRIGDLSYVREEGDSIAIGSLTTPALTFTYTHGANNRRAFTAVLPGIAHVLNVEPGEVHGTSHHGVELVGARQGRNHGLRREREERADEYQQEHERAPADGDRGECGPDDAGTAQRATDRH